MSTCLTIKQAANAVGVSYSTLARWIRDGDGPRHFQLGGVIRIERDELVRWWLDHYGLSPKRVQILARLKTLSLVERYSKRLKLASDVSWLGMAPTMKPFKARRQA